VRLTVGLAALELVQRELEHRRAVAAQGPAAEPAAISLGVDAHHLIELVAGGIDRRVEGQSKGRLDGGEADAVALMEVHGVRPPEEALENAFCFFIISTGSWD
jgi:hypothetical protein